jgi:hypothetical protein
MSRARLRNSIAHEQPREVANRVAKACQRLFEIHAESAGNRQSTPFSVEQATAMYRIAGELSKAEHPLTTPVSLG